MNYSDLPAEVKTVLTKQFAEADLEDLFFTCENYHGTFRDDSGELIYMAGKTEYDFHESNCTIITHNLVKLMSKPMGAISVHAYRKMMQADAYFIVLYPCSEGGESIVYKCV